MLSDKIMILGGLTMVNGILMQMGSDEYGFTGIGVKMVNNGTEDELITKQNEVHELYELEEVFRYSEVRLPRDGKNFVIERDNETTNVKGETITLNSELDVKGIFSGKINTLLSYLWPHFLTCTRTDMSGHPIEYNVIRDGYYDLIFSSYYTNANWDGLGGCEQSVWTIDIVQEAEKVARVTVICGQNVTYYNYGDKCDVHEYFNPAGVLDALQGVGLPNLMQDW